MAINKDRQGKLISVDYQFSGMNTVQDPSALGTEECVSISNMDALAPYGVRTRFGYTEVLSTASHSAWSDGTTAYCVAGGSLCRFSGSSLTPLYPVNQNLPMAFEKVNNIVVATNSQDYLIIDEVGTVSHATPSTAEFKVAPPAGEYLAYYNGRLYIASGNVLYCTDPYSVDQCDERQWMIPITEDKITGITAVDDGIWVGTTNNIFFLHGEDAYGGNKFRLLNAALYGVIPRTMLMVAAEKVPLAKVKGWVVVLTTPRGICVGSNSGQFINVSELKVGMPQQSQAGAAFIKEYNGQTHYVTVLTNTDPYNAYIQPDYDTDEAELN